MKKPTLDAKFEKGFKELFYRAYRRVQEDVCGKVISEIKEYSFKRGGWWFNNVGRVISPAFCTKSKFSYPEKGATMRIWVKYGEGIWTPIYAHGEKPVMYFATHEGAEPFYNFYRMWKYNKDKRIEKNRVAGEIVGEYYRRVLCDEDNVEYIPLTTEREIISTDKNFATMKPYELAARTIETIIDWDKEKQISFIKSLFNDPYKASEYKFK